MKLWITLALAITSQLASAQERVSAQAPAVAQFVTLGTLGGVRPSPTRAQPANLLLSGDQLVLIDAGDGTVRQLGRAGVPVGRVTALILSHYHFDHIGGVAAILGSRFQSGAPRPLAIYGPPGTAEIVKGLIAGMGPSARSGDGIPGSPRRDPAAIATVQEVGDGATFRLGDIVVRTAQNSHYSFVPGSPDDKALKSLSFRFDTPGRSILYTGDTGPSTKVEALGKGADLLVSEMIDLDQTLAQIGRMNGGRALPPKAMVHLAEQHLTPGEVGRMARAMGVKKVVLTHLVVGDAAPDRLAADVAEIRKVYNGDVTVANDLDRF